MRMGITAMATYTLTIRGFAFSSVTCAGMQTDTVAQQASFVSDKAHNTHVAEALKLGADLQSRGTLLYRTLHPAIVGHMLMPYGRAVVDIFASRENAQCMLLFSMHDPDMPLNMGAFRHPSSCTYFLPWHRHTLILTALHRRAMAWLVDIYQLWSMAVDGDMLSQGQCFTHTWNYTIWLTNWLLLLHDNRF